MATKSLTFLLFGKDATASRTLDNVGAHASRMGDRFRTVGRVATLALAAIATGAVAFGVSSVKAYADAEEQQNKLAFAFKKFPALADTNQKALQKLNAELQKKTRFDDDATAAGQATLAQYQLTGKQIMQLTPLMQDYAQKTGKDLPTAANDLGKALLGQGRALKAVGIDFKDTGTVGGNFDQIIQGLSTSVGGLAEAAGTTAAGRLEIMRNRFGEIQETVGAALMPALEGLLDMFETQLMPGIEAFASWLATDGIPAVSAFIDWIVKWKDVIGPAVAAIGTLTAALWLFDAAAAANPIGLIVAGLIAVIAIATLVTTAFDNIWAWFMDHPWAAALTPLLGGVATITLAINALIKFGPQLWAFFSQLFTNFMNTPIIGGRTFGQLAMIVAGVVAFIGGAFGQVIAAIQRVISFLIQLGTWAWQMSGQIFGAIGSVAGAFGRLVGAALGMLGGVGNAISGVIGWFSRLVGGAQGAAGGIGGAVGGMIGHFGRIMGAVGGIPGQIVGAFQRIVGQFAGIGANIVGGLIGGIRGAIGGAVSAAANAAASMLAAAKGALGIKSPSRKFRDEVGKQIPAGIGEGIQAGKSGLNKIVSSLVDVPRSPGSTGTSTTTSTRLGGGGPLIQIINKAGVALSDLIDVKIQTANGWQSMELESGVGR